MKAVILAGGLGTRLRPFTEVIPKPLLPVGTKSLLEIQLERLRSHGFDEIYLATNYKSDYIANFFGDGARYGVRLVISQERKQLGTAGPVLLLKDQLTEPFIVMNGDILSTIDFRKFFQTALDLQVDLCVAIKKIFTPFGFGRITHDGNYLTGVEEKPNFETEILAGIYVFAPGVFDLIPPDEYFGVDSLIKKMLAEQRSIGTYVLTEYWLDIGQVPDYEKAQKDFELYFGDETPKP
jgi:NDP-sugar pyrophosphorylase family protein